jgi:xanthine/uracil/vitamin C permease (AzgA family)
MDQSILGNLLVERSMGRVLMRGPMARNTKVSGPTTKLKVKEFMTGLMVANSMVAGRKISYTAVEDTLGLMAAVTRESTLKTKSRDLEFTYGLMAKSTRDPGSTVSSTARVNSRTRKARVESESGLREKGSVGL